MYLHGQQLTQDNHFQDHVDAGVPVQVYYQNQHKDIGFIELYNRYFIQINHTFYSRETHIFISRPGY
ncbi:hypothetical protein A8709_01040 [Paenibacillus pectinilyticus]|uniref:Uncharacterized protein n=1 Tax=Paenibacillus pectinilyticus TaxID=512399 RepID=A0A1C0ZYM1_9BACL|nr:hypothetical protein A8709_01040 [Paenibacillus pectinilyticus]